MTLRFRFRPGLAAATLIALAILIGLGSWQLQRRAWKEGLIAQLETRAAAAPITFDAALARADAGEAMEYARVYLDGAYDPAREAHVFGVRDGVSGVYVFTPLRRAGAPDVYVNRGFVAGGATNVPPLEKGGPGGDHPHIRPLVETPAGPVRVAGILRAPQRLTATENLVAAKDQPEDNLYFARDPARFAGAAGAAPFYVESDGAESPGAGPAPALSRADFPNRHLEYALTWFGLAAALLGVFAAASIRR